MIWLAVVGAISQSELCSIVLTNQIHTNVVGKISHGDAVMRWCGDVVNVVGWQGASQMTD